MRKYYQLIQLDNLKVGNLLLDNLSVPRVFNLTILEKVAIVSFKNISHLCENTKDSSLLKHEHRTMNHSKVPTAADLHILMNSCVPFQYSKSRRSLGPLMPCIETEFIKVFKVGLVKFETGTSGLRFTNSGAVKSLFGFKAEIINTHTKH